MDIQRLRLIIDSAPAAEGAAQWSRYTRQVGQDATAATQPIMRMESALESVGRTLRMVAGAAGVGLGVGKVIEYADSYRRLEGQIKLVADSQREVLRTERDLFDVANRTRSSYEATANLYVRVAQNAKELGRTQGEVMRFTETVQKAIQIGGSGTQEAKAGVIQLGQALGAGVLRGDEFRSVMENMRGVSQTLAQGLGVTVGQLREMANNGELTAQKVVDAMLRMSDTVDERFKRVPLTIGNAFTVADNEIRRYIGETDRGLGASSALAGGIMLLAKNITFLANAAVLFGAAKLAGVISGLIGPTLQEAKAVATGNAVLLNSREAHVMRATAAKEAAAATLAASQSAAAGLRAELAAITELQQAERRRYAEATTRVRRAVPEGQLAPLGSNVQMRDNAAVVMAMKQRAESEALLASLGARRAQVQADINAVDAVALAATRANTAANIQRAMATNVSTAAMVANAVAARAAAAAAGAFSAAMALVGGPIGAAILALMLFVGWLLKKQSAEAEAVEEANRHTAAMREQKSAVDALNRSMAEEITDLNKQQQALDSGGLKALDRAKKEIAARDMARKSWKEYQEALKNDNSYEASVVKELTLEQALRHRSAAVVAAARTRVEMAGLTISAQARLDAAEERAKDAAEKRTQAQAEATRKLKEESEARKKAAADIKAEGDEIRTNSMAIGESRKIRDAWAMVAKINTEIHRRHAEAVVGDSEAVAREKAALRDLITQEFMQVDALERMTKARNSLRDATDDIDVDIANAKALGEAWKQGADAVQKLTIEQSADAAIRRMTLGLSDQQIAAMKEELDAYRQKLILLGQLNAANQAAASAQKQDAQQARQEAKDIANDTEQLVKNALRGAQRAAADFFESILSGGVNSFQRLVDAMRTMFVRLFAELIAMQLGRKLIDAMASVQRGEPLLRGGTGPLGQGPTWQQKGMVYGAAGLGGGLLGYGVGQAAGNYAVAGLGGAASGAMAGFMVGGPIGAIVGGVVGLVGGLLGHAAKVKKEKEELEKARKAFFTELDKFVYGLGDHTGLEKSLHDLQAQFDEVKRKAAELGLSNKDLAAAQRAVADATARMKKEFLESIDAQIREAEGRGYINEAIEAQKRYQDNLKDIALAGGDVSKATDLFIKQLDRLGDGLSVEQLQDLIRTLPELTKGMDAAAVDALTKALNDDLTAAMNAAAKAAAAAAEELRRASEDLQVRYARATGGPAQIMSLEFAQRREMADARAAGASPEYLAQLQLVHLFEMAQQKVQDQTDAEVKAIQEATREEQDRLEELAKIARDELRVQEDALGVAQQNLSATQKVVQSLTSYANSLLVGDLSPLSPEEKYKESRAQLESVYTQALGGDRDAALKFPELAQVFLQLSRGYNASGPDYVRDFTGVQDMLRALNDKYAEQQTAEEEIVAKLQEQVDLLRQQIEDLQKQSDEAATAAAEQIAALQDSARIQELIRAEVVAAIDAQRDATLSRLDAELLQLEGVKNGLDELLASTDAQIYEVIRARIAAEQAGVDNLAAFDRQFAELVMARTAQQAARDKVVEQIEATRQARDMVNTTSNALRDAVNRGASFTDAGFRSLEVLLAQQHAADVSARKAEVDRIVHAIEGLNDPLDLEPLDTHPWRRRRPLIPATGSFVADAGADAIVATDPELVSALRDVVTELKGIRRESQTAAAEHTSVLSQLSIDFGEIAQQNRFTSRETV